MARSVSFGGQIQFKPGAISSVSAAQFGIVGLSTRGIVALIGEADGGTPGTAITLDDPSLSATTFRSGPLADAANLVFNPGNDPRIPGGAFRVIAYKVNRNATQGTLQLPTDTGILVSDTAAAGSTTTAVNLTTGGLVVNAYTNRWFRWKGDQRIIVSNTANQITVTPALSGTPVATEPVQVLKTKVAVGDYAAAASTTTTINFTTGGLTADGSTNSPLRGRWLKIAGEQRRIATVPTATSVTVSQGFNTAPATNTLIHILHNDMVFTARDYGTHTNSIGVELEPGVVNTLASIMTLSFETKAEQSPELGGTAYLRLKYVGGPIPTVTGGGLAQGAIGAVTATTVAVTLPGAPTSGTQFNGMVLQLPGGIQRLIASHTSGGSPCTFTLDSAQTLSTTEQATVSSPSGQTATVRNVTSAGATMTGASGLSTGLTGTIAPTADTSLNISSFSTLNLSTLRNLIDYVNTNTNWQASVPSGVNQDTVLTNSFDYGYNATAVDCRFDGAVSPTTKGLMRRDVAVMTDWVNTNSTLVTAIRAIVDTSDGMDLTGYTGGSAGTAKDIVLNLAGGTRGTSTNSDWQAGFDAMLQQRVNQIVPLISQDLTNEGYGSTATHASVAAQLLSHVLLTSGSYKSERGGYIGKKGTKSSVLTFAQTMNNTDIQVFPQQFTFPNVSGTLTKMPEWSAAVAAAGMRAGTREVGDSMTFKYIRCSAVDQDTSWSPKSLTDINDMIAGGVMFAETVSGRGFRWVRDMTSYLLDDRIVYMDGSTREAVRFLVYDVRTFLENEFTGLKAKPATVANLRERTGARLQALREDGVIVNSIDPDDATGTKIVPGFRKLRVVVTGDVATIFVEVFPCTSISFQLLSINLLLPVISA